MTVRSFKAFWSLDIFQVDATESRRDAFHNFDKFLRIFFVDFDVKNINARVNLKEKTIALHPRFTGNCTNISESENCSTI